MLHNIDTKDEENRSDTRSCLSGRSGEPLPSSNAAPNHVSVRPASQYRAVSPAALFSAAPTATNDDDFFDFFARRHIFSSTFSFSNDDNRALRDLSLDSTMMSPLLCDTAYLSVS